MLPALAGRQIPREKRPLKTMSIVERAGEKAQG